ncbi:uncharacterized protein BO97DRAFT_389014 [Aspergillus homomorphus CBS 101889]|uniref:BTB domain-containing protein n=1 Tax=Aspergillus homomorphus (strain CBS 101889) TaxID=1450537 RepID=A0A395I0J5_ASPHC|nr:hypothetical protein BO97DRAFT_389014 [Aspergillus homomorphus CBS 101889]RAL13199.1 hypothetical protein BO97DRAFT_389014 [Aspergillus homomorphus CBS 101889]
MEKKQNITNRNPIAESDPTPATEEAYEPPVSEEVYEPSVSEEAYEPSVSEEAYEPSVSEEAYEPPVSEEAVEAPVKLEIPSLEEYSQRSESPYTTPLITLKVNNSYYAIPQYYLRPFDRLHCDPKHTQRAPRRYNDWYDCFEDNKPYHLELAIEPQIAHTFIHYLCTGNYETLQSSFIDPQTTADLEKIVRARDTVELTRAAHTYAAAVRYQIPGLQRTAHRLLEQFAERLSIEDILTVARGVYTSLHDEDESGRTWLEDFVRDKLAKTYKDRDGCLRRLMKVYDIGKDENFDRFVLDEVLALYENEKGELKSALERPESFSEPELCVEPEPEPVLEPESEPEPQAPAIPDNPLYNNWWNLNSKDRKRREKQLVKKGLPIPGRDFELPTPPNGEPAPEPEPEPELEPEPFPEQEPIPEPQPIPELDSSTGQDVFDAYSNGYHGIIRLQKTPIGKEGM